MCTTLCAWWNVLPLSFAFILSKLKWISFVPLKNKSNNIWIDFLIGHIISVKLTIIGLTFINHLPSITRVSSWENSKVSS
jgi:hypothetical protein